MYLDINPYDEVDQITQTLSQQGVPIFLLREPIMCRMVRIGCLGMIRQEMVTAIRDYLKRNEKKHETNEVVSIIIPIYNVGSLFETMFGNGYPSDLPLIWKLFWVNDGSPDQSEGDLQRIFRKDARIRFVRQENGAYLLLAIQGLS